MNGESMSMRELNETTVTSEPKSITPEAIKESHAKIEDTSFREMETSELRENAQPHALEDVSDRIEAKEFQPVQVENDSDDTEENLGSEDVKKDEVSSYPVH